MAEEHHHVNLSDEMDVKPMITREEPTEMDIKDRGMFDFMGKKDEEKKPEGDVLATDLEKVHVSEPEKKIEEPKVEHPKEDQPKEGKVHKIKEKLHRSGSSSSSSSSSSDEEGGVGEKGEKKKKKKGLKEKLLEKKEEKKAEKEHGEDTSVPVEKHVDDKIADPSIPPEEKKGFLEKIKEKLPGQHKKPAEEVPPPPPTEEVPPPPPSAEVHEGEPKEKKGILEKIKEKLPGYHHKTEEEKEKEKEKEVATH